MTLPPDTAALLEAATQGYRRAGRFAWHFARGKLRGDPSFAGILAHGLLAERRRVLDLGCGQGLLAVWLLAARACYARRAWPAAWPAPPQLTAYTGIELSCAEVERARTAFADHAGVRLEVVAGNITAVPYPEVDAVVILDVLHYLEPQDQEQVLRRVLSALVPRGVLLLRIGDAAGGLGFRLSQITDRWVVLFRRGHWLPLHCRTVSQWRQLLEQIGFRTSVIPMSAGTPFSNVLLRAEAP